MNSPIPYIAFGGGTQSTALVVLACKGKIAPRPSFAVFADTGDEPPWVYRTVDATRTFAAKHGLEVVTRSRAISLSEDILRASRGESKRFETSPAFTAGGGTLMRKCTQHFKSRVIQREVRARVGRRGKAIGYIGISLDEPARIKPSTQKWLEFRWPLVDLGLRRSDCIEIVREALGFTPQRSACVHCPYHSEDYWAMLQREAPESFARACEIDRAYQAMAGKAGVLEPSFLSPRRIPLETIKFGAQGRFDGFDGECGGFCGV